MFRETDVFLVLGQRGCGKSYLAQRIQRCYPRKVVFDTLAEYDDESDGVFLVSSFQEFSQVLIRSTREKWKRYTIVFQFDLERENNVDEFNEALRVLHYHGRYSGKSVLVVVEEVQNFASTHAISHWLRNALLTGRHAHLGLLFTTQRPGECHKTIISQAHHLFLGRIFEKNDIDYCRAVLASEPLKLQRLPDRIFLYRKPDGTLEFVNNSLRAVRLKTILPVPKLNGNSVPEEPASIGEEK